MNELIFKQTFLKLIEPELTVVEGQLNVGELKFVAFHDQDCCESVFADFEAVLPQAKEVKDNGKIVIVELKKVPDMGFLIILHGTHGKTSLLVNCYNSQNGYYSDQLTVTVTHGKEELFKFDPDKKEDIG